MSMKYTFDYMCTPDEDINQGHLYSVYLHFSVTPCPGQIIKRLPFGEA